MRDTGERLAYDFVADLCRATADHANVLGGSAGEIEDAAANEWATIIDADDDAASVFAVGNFQLRAKCQRTMCCSIDGRVHTFPGGGFGAKCVP